jgi:hypothetical protein
MSASFLSPELAALESTNSKQGSLSQDPEMVQKLLTAAPPWVKDGHGIAGKQQPRESQSAGDSGSSVSKPLSMNIQSETKSAPFMVSSGGAGGGSESTFLFPFQGTLSSDTKTSQDYVTINPNSDLYPSYAIDFKTDLTDITGLGVPLEVNIGDLVWLELQFNNGGSIQKAQIMTTTTGSFDITAPAWSENAYVESNSATPPWQVRARKLLVTVDEDDNGNTALYQHVFYHLVMQNLCIDGFPARYPVPY